MENERWQFACRELADITLRQVEDRRGGRLRDVKGRHLDFTQLRFEIRGLFPARWGVGRWRLNGVRVKGWFRLKCRQMPRQA